MDYAALLQKLKKQGPSYIRYTGGPEEAEMAPPAAVQPPPEGEVVIEELPTEIDVEADLAKSARMKKKSKPAKAAPRDTPSPHRQRPKASPVDETASMPGNVPGDMVEGTAVHSEEGFQRQQYLNKALRKPVRKK